MGDNGRDPLGTIEKGIIVGMSALIVYVVYSPSFLNYIRIGDFIPMRQETMRKLAISAQPSIDKNARPPILI
jgi:hypothetical protein